MNTHPGPAQAQEEPEAEAEQEEDHALLALSMVRISFVAAVAPFRKAISHKSRLLMNIFWYHGRLLHHDRNSCVVMS
jgi:hypothetical protein